MNLQEYLIKDYTEDHNFPELSLVYGDDIWEKLSTIREEERLVAIYLLGDCPLDWYRMTYEDYQGN